MQYRKAKWASSQLRKGRDRMQEGKKNALKKVLKAVIYCKDETFNLHEQKNRI